MDARTSDFPFSPFRSSSTATVLGVNIVFLPRNQNPLISAIDGVPPLAGARALRRCEAVFRRPDRERPVRIARRRGAARPGAADHGAAGAGAAAVRGARQAIQDQAISARRTRMPTVNGRRSCSRPRDARKNRSRNTCRTAIEIRSISSRPRTPQRGDRRCLSLRRARRGAESRRSSRQDEEVSWGQVFANAMRQPLLATALGMIYHTQITVDAANFAKGGWLYVDLADGSDYKAQQTADPNFVRRYAARIPVLEAGKPRSVFGAIQFPVLAARAAGQLRRALHRSRRLRRRLCQDRPCVPAGEPEPAA